MTFYQLRHSRASIDLAHQRRNLPEAQRRGAWSQAESMHKYEHSARMGSDFDKLTLLQRCTFDLLCRKHLAAIMMGRNHPARHSKELVHRRPTTCA